MKLKSTTLIWCAGLILGAMAIPVHAADAPAAGKKETLVLGKVKVGDSVTKGSAEEGRSNKLSRVAEAVDAEFQASLSGTRKFTLIAGADLGSIMDEFKKDPLMSKDHPDAHVVGEMTPPKYVVVCTLDDFQDVAQKLDEGGNGDMRARYIRVNIVTNIYKINSGEVYESFSSESKIRKPVGDSPNIHQTGDSLDELLLAQTKDAAHKAAQRVVDIYYPAKILSRIDKTVQINRGDGTSIAVGQLWDAYAQGEEIKDPDTGEVLGKQEVASGSVRITAVYPKYSTGEVVDNAGVDKGNVLRLHDDNAKPK